MRRPALLQDAGTGRARKRQEALSQLQQLRLQSRLRVRPNWQRLHARRIQPQLCGQVFHLKLQEVNLQEVNSLGVLLEARLWGSRRSEHAASADY